MRRTIITLLLMGHFLTGFAQSLFEGEIIYHNTYESRVPNLTSEQIANMMGTEQQYFIRDGHYKSIMNGTSIAFQLFDPQTNRLYTKTQQSDTLYWFDAVVNTDQVISFEIMKNKEKVLGVECDVLVLITKSGKSTYSYSSKYKADPSLFAKHNFGNWFYFLSKSGALPLKMTIETKQLAMESIAVDVRKMKLEKYYFEIPPGIPLKQTI